MQGYVDDGKAAGITTAVMRHGKVAHLESVGWRDLENNLPMRPDTICRIASMIKPITSVATMMLYEEGKILLTDPVSEYLPQFKDVQVNVAGTADDPQLEPPNSGPTIQDLLRHTAGLTLHQAAEVARPGLTREEMLARWATVPLEYQPGEGYNYHPSYSLLPYLVETVSGLSFDEFIHEKILSPLGMMDTRRGVPTEKLDRFAKLYDWTTNQRLTVATDEPAEWQGATSTAIDYLRFCQMILNGGELDGERILMPATVRLMLMDHLKPELHPGNPGKGYGLGFGVVRDPVLMGQVGSVGEANWAGANTTFFWIDRKADLIYMLFSQLEPRNPWKFMKRMPPLAHAACLD
jgi:CubicO group peptidase (beta-lactamase class C family)